MSAVLFLSKNNKSEINIKQNPIENYCKTMRKNSIGFIFSLKSFHCFLIQAYLILSEISKALTE